MMLVGMFNLDKQALICDLAETYGIFDYKALPVNMVALFSLGLRDNSRIKLKMAGQTQSNDTLLLALIYDNLTAYFSGKKPKTSMFDVLQNPTKVERRDYRSYSNGEAFDRARRRIIENNK